MILQCWILILGVTCDVDSNIVLHVYFDIVLVVFVMPLVVALVLLFLAHGHAFNLYIYMRINSF